MSSPVVPDLGTNTNARKYVPEVNTGTTAAPVWTPIGGVKNFTPVTDDAQLQDDRRFSDKGYNRQNKTGTGWTASLMFSRAPQAADSTLYDVGQEYLRAHGEGKIGQSAQVDIRWYEYDEDATLPRIVAKKGTALVTYNEPNGGPLDNSDATVTFEGQGQLLDITHPYPATPAVPNIDSVDNRAVGTAGGDSVMIHGQHFNGTTAVTVAGTAVTNKKVVNDSTLVITTPAKAAGSYALVVTNAVGASTTGGTLTYS